MKLILLIPFGVASLAISSCSSTQNRPIGDVEAIERQTPVTQNPNAIGDALNARNAVDYSNGSSYGRNRGQNSGRYGY